MEYFGYNLALNCSVIKYSAEIVYIDCVYVTYYNRILLS